MTGFLRLELARSFRDPRYLVLAIAAPVGFYLLFAGIFTGRGTSEGQLPAQVEIMVAMATFGAMWGAWLAGQRRRFAPGSSWLAGLSGWPRSRWPPAGAGPTAAEATCESASGSGLAAQRLGIRSLSVMTTVPSS